MEKVQNRTTDINNSNYSQLNGFGSRWMRDLKGSFNKSGYGLLTLEETQETFNTKGPLAITSYFGMAMKNFTSLDN